MIDLPDVNVLVAAVVREHVHHDEARSWLRGREVEGWATCPTTESGFVRVCSNPAVRGGAARPLDAVAMLRDLVGWGRHTFWADDVPLADRAVRWERLQGYRQVTDAHLAALALAHGGRLVTLDRRIAGVLGDAPVRVLGAPKPG